MCMCLDIPALTSTLQLHLILLTRETSATIGPDDKCPSGVGHSPQDKAKEDRHQYRSGKLDQGCLDKECQGLDTQYKVYNVG